MVATTSRRARHRVLEHKDGNLQRADELYRAIDPFVVAWAYTSLDHGLLGFKRLHNLGNVELELGNYLAARESFIAALKERPEHTVSAMSLFKAALNEHDADTAQVDAQPCLTGRRLLV